VEKEAMKHWKGLVLGLALALLVAGPVLAQEEGAEEPAKAKKAEKRTLRGEYAIMAGECEMTDAQKAELEAALKAKSDALAANKTKLEDLRKQQADAKEQGDKEAQKRVGDEMKALKEQLSALEAEHNAKIATVLTPEQCQAWEGFKLYRGLMRRYNKAELDEGQKAKVRGLANEAAKKMLAVAGAGKEAKDAKSQIEQELKASVENDVLTAEQKEKIKPAAKEPKEKAGEEGGEKPAEI
jgi:Spy/CpxP family protein refolding chaperone